MNINLFIQKQKSCLCGKSPLINGSSYKSLKITSFKDCVQSNEYKNQVRGSKFGKNPVKLSYIACGNRKMSSRATEGCVAINGLCKHWLTVLPLASGRQDETSLNRVVETDHKHGIWKWIWSNLKIPTIIFVPLFLTVNMKYGAKVANELSPLWIGGPLLVALYIKAVQVLCSLYVFSFEGSVKLLTMLHGMVKPVRLWQHVVYFMNLDHKRELKRIWKEFLVWLVDTGLDFVGSIWSYRKMVMVLKMAKIM